MKKTQTKHTKMQPLNRDGVRDRVIENAGRKDKFAFAPTSMAIAFVQAAVA